MPTFSSQLWRARATRRFNNAVSAGKKRAYVGYTRDLDAIASIDVVIAWCTKQGLDVNFGRKCGGVLNREEGKITVNGRLSPEVQLYVLLHECGHFLIGKPAVGERFSSTYFVVSKTVARTTLHRINVVDEEFEAWARGFKLSKRLKVKVDIDRYNRTRAEYIKTYLLWVLRATADEEDDA